MSRVLLVTNDFPPTLGGIQSYLRDFVATLDPSEVVVLCSTQDGSAAAAFDAQLPYRVVRMPQRVLLPTPSVAAKMADIIAEEHIDVVWFGAAAPLGLLGPVARRAGVRRIVASTHGHEVGWSMLPIARQLLRRIGDHADVVTYISAYTLRRLQPAFGASPRFIHLPSGVSAAAFRRPDPLPLPPQLSGIPADAPIVLCMSRLVARKGQDSLIRVWPEILKKHPEAFLVIVGQGRYESVLRRLASRTRNIRITGRVSQSDAVALLHHCALFAMPARTRGRGLDVEGLGIVYLEAQAAGRPVIAGDSGGAPETVTAATGRVVAGRDRDQLRREILTLLGDDNLRATMGKAGREHVEKQWNWELLGQRLRLALFN
ncbi:glycosyltransferase family 4 protein [Corynebacterium epidermidicanis]|uniref:Glycosyltransferase n=1 Tax=Corynebacterium epidermidicanis TaxID=1050174 RepID=A0A0G3GQY1_9CORY|nr:glycosyltransferase family 4 protein [Corynebacterium epidermidicanis]AKK03544.1 glycosyltransferase [Corynebacterium epidermidicanis]